MTNNENTIYIGTSYFPNGNKVPEVLTPEEAITLLRLDIDGPRNPLLTLQHYRDKGLLRATKIGKRVRYTRTEILNFLARQTENTNKQ